MDVFLIFLVTLTICGYIGYIAGGIRAKNVKGGPSAYMKKNWPIDTAILGYMIGCPIAGVITCIVDC